MNDIKDLLISRISDIKVLLRQQPLFTYTQDYPSPKPSSKTSIHCPQALNSHNIHDKITSQSCLNYTPFNNPSQNSNSQRNHNNQTSNRLSALVKIKQKARNSKQTKIFHSINVLSFHNDRQLENLYFHFIDIFASFDHDFAKYKNPAHFLTLSMGQNLKKVFCFFFLKHQDPQKCKQLIPQIMRRQISDLSPAFFLGTIRKWSISILNSLLNLNEDKNQCKIDIKVDLKKIQDKILHRNLTSQPCTKEQKNNFNFITKSKSPRESLNKAPNQVSHKKSNSFRTIVNNIMNTTNQFSTQINIGSKQMVYAYCLDDLKKYYKMLPLEDLDIGYLRNIKKVGRKQDLFCSYNIKNTVEVLIQTKNSQIRSLMAQFQSQYAKFKQNNSHFKMNNEMKKPSQQQRILAQENRAGSNEKNLQIAKRSLQDLSIKNLKSLFDLNSKLLTPSYNQRQSYKNRIKFNHVKNQQILCESLTDLTRQLQNQCSQSILVDKPEKQTKIIDYSSVLTRQISQETTQIQNKIKLLKRINKKNKDLKEKYAEVKKKAHSKQSNVQDEVTECFVDEHIEPNQKISKLPKILSKDKTIENQFQSPQDQRSYPNYSVQKRRKQSSLSYQRLNKSSISRENHLLFKAPNMASQQFIALLPRKSMAPEKPIDKISLNRRFLSQAAEKQSADNTSVEDNERPLSNFSFKCKAFGVGSKKSSYNAIRFQKNKNSKKHECGAIQNVDTIHEKIKIRFGFKQNSVFEIKPKTPSNIFNNQKASFHAEGNKDDFIKYLKNLQNERFLSQKSKCSPSKQKQRSIRKKFTYV